jgi:hypothetical protein
MGRKKKQSKGLGDDIANVLETTGVKKIVDIFLDGKDCGCDKRKDKLNVLFPKKRLKARCLTEQEFNQWSEFKQVRTLKLSAEQVKYVINLYASVFNVTPFNCPTCSPKVILEQIDRLDKVHETYLN